MECQWEEVYPHLIGSAWAWAIRNRSEAEPKRSEDGQRQMANGKSPLLGPPSGVPVAANRPIPLVIYL
jgi:hypothetical protein